MHTITIRFRKNYFSDENGAVLGYSIIVGEDFKKNTEGEPFLPNWREVQKYSTWPPYQVKPYDPYKGKPYNPFEDNSDEIEDFTVGSEDCKTGFDNCNGKLKPGTIYKFKVRRILARQTRVLESI